MRLYIAQKNDIENVKSLYESAFPRAERKIFEIIYEKSKTGEAEILCIADGGFAGFAITVFYKDMALLDYFAVTEKKRNSGIGSEALAELKKRYADKRFFLDMESVRIKADNYEMRLRRRDFYIRNGMKIIGEYVSLFGNEMEIASDGSVITARDYKELYTAVFGEEIAAGINEV